MKRSILGVGVASLVLVGGFAWATMSAGTTYGAYSQTVTNSVTAASAPALMMMAAPCIAEPDANDPNLILVSDPDVVFTVTGVDASFTKVDGGYLVDAPEGAEWSAPGCDAESGVIEATVSPKPSSSPSPTVSPTASPTASPSVTPAVDPSPTVEPTPIPTTEPTTNPTPEPTVSPSPTP